MIVEAVQPAPSPPRSRGEGWATIIRRLLLIAALVPAALFAADTLFPPPLGRLDDLSVAMLDRTGAPLRVFTNAEQAWRLPATFDDVAPVYRDLLVTYEDKRFFEHWGVDPWAVARAFGQNLAAGRTVSGASTLTMQVARLLEPRPRTLRAKLIEMARALQLEWRYDKRAILGMYLTLAPFGGNVEGVRAAALTLFGKAPRELTAAEAALLVALPQAPSRLRPDRAPERALAARAKVLDRAVAAAAIPLSVATEAGDEAIPARRLAMPMLAPHLGDRLRAERPGQSILRTTVDGDLQRAVEDLARREAQALLRHAGLAILVVDNLSRTVVVHVGAPDYLDEARNGPIDMTRATRSPGSALKPFIYGLGFDDRAIHPETLVSDVSTRFGDYAPANFDKGFHGEMTVREALQRSLNVPAVLVLDRVGPVRFAANLRRAGARLVLPSAVVQPGLPLALGGASISLWDMTMLYTGLARGGMVAPLTADPDAPARTPVRLMSDVAAWQVLRILEGTPPPSGMVQAREVGRSRTIGIKTGTSYGFRDAWCFGVSTRYTVGVWVGRPDGTPSPDHYGRNTAAPIVYRVFDRLPDDGPASAMPAALREAASAIPPELLRRLGTGEAPDRPIHLPDPDRLRLVFPTSGIALDLTQPDGSVEPLAMTAAGGRRPLTWLVNGRPVESSPMRRETSWRPDGAGFARITVIDADGRSAAADFRVR